MKKLYFLDESEKERILKLHESHTKKQYLMQEQATYYDALSQGTLGSTLRGAGAGAQMGMFAGVPGMIIGGTVGGLIGALYSSNDRPTFNGNIRELCTANKVGPAINSDKLDDIAKNLNNLINTTNYLGGGYATDDSAKKIAEQLGSIASIPDLCGVIQNYKEIYNKDLMSVLSDEFYKSEAWINSVKIPLRKAIKKTEEVSKNAGTSTSNANVPENWKSYPCVPKSQGITPVKDIEGKTIISYKRYSEKKGKNITYQPDGTYWWEGMVERRYYKCDGDGIVDAQDYSALDSKKEKASGGGTNTGGGDLSARVSAVQQKLGLTQSGKMDQATINALMAKIQGGTNTTTNTATSPQAKGVQ
jgi:hypothetical protein